MSVLNFPACRFVAFLVLTIGIISQVPTSYAQSSNPANYEDNLETYIQTQMETYNIPGLAVAVVQEGEVAYMKGFGIANDDNAPVTPDTPFLLASVSKSITALGVLQLVETGQIALEDPVQKHIPWFEVDNELTNQITIADLLHHTSGLPELEGFKSLYKPDRPNAIAEGVRDLAALSLHSQPGTVMEYSNLNYNVLGLVIEEVSGQSYQSYIEENIFAPLDMLNSYANLPAVNEGYVASGYYPFFGNHTIYEDHQGHSGTSLPAAGLWSSASDMSHYLIAHLDDGQYGDVSILSPAGLAIMHNPGFEINPGFGYGGGFFINSGFDTADHMEAIDTSLKSHDELTLIWHEGNWSNFKSNVLIIPEAELGVVLLMNKNDPTISSVFRFMGWDIATIATGAEIQYTQPDENFLIRYGRWNLSIAAILLLVGWLWTARQLGRRRVSLDGRDGVNWGRVILYVGLPLGISSLLLGLIYLKVLPENATTLPILLRFGPDLGILIGLITILCLGWNLTNLSLILKSLRQNRSRIIASG